MVAGTHENGRTHKDMTQEEKNKVKPPIWLFWRARRYVLGLLTFFGFICTYLLRVNLSVAIVAMTQYYNVTLPNGTTIVKRDFDWDTHIQGYLLSSFFYGYIFTQILGAYLGVRYGGKIIFTIGIGVASLLTLITPCVAYLNVYLLLAVRIFEGFFEGLIVPSCQALWTNWAPPQERGRLLTLGLCGSYVGTVIGLPASSALATYCGWPSIFYVFGAIGLIWCITWSILACDSPSKDSRISKEEKKYIIEALEGLEVKKDIKIPILQILSTPPVWAYIVCAACEVWGFYTMLTQLPKFMKYAINLDLNSSGMLSALPSMAVGITVHLTGHLVDYLESKKICTKTTLRKTFMGCGFTAQCVFIVLSIHWLSPVTTTLCLVLAIGFGGFSMSVFAVNSLDLSPKFAGILIGIANTVATVPGIISPIITGYVVTDETDISQWSIIFYIAGGVYLSGAVLFVILGSAKLQPWDYVSEDTMNIAYINDGFQVEGINTNSKK